MTDTAHTDQSDETHIGSPKDASAFQQGKSAATNRWVLLIIGIVTVLAGLLALVMPFFASITAVLLVGWLLIASGVVGLISAFRRQEGWHLAAAFALSIISVIGGVVMLAQPIAGILALTTILIAYFAVSGVFRIYYGAHAIGDGGGWMIATGVLSVILAVLVFLGLPFSATWVPGLMLGVDLVFWGAVQIALGLREGRTGETEIATG